MQNPQPLLKVSVFFSKLDSIDHDTFFTHWNTTHANLASAAQSFKDHIVRYTQVRRRSNDYLRYTLCNVLTKYCIARRLK